MRRFCFLFLAVAGAAAVAADNSSSTPSVEARLGKLEILRTADLTLCRKSQRLGRGHSCSVGSFRNTLAFVYDVNLHRVLSPRWMTSKPYYMIHFQYDVEGRCPTILRSLLRQILEEELSVTVQRENHDSEVLVMGPPLGEAAPAVSKEHECTFDAPPQYFEPQPATASFGVNGTSNNVPFSMDGRDMYPAGEPYEGPSDSPLRTYRGCTAGEIAEQLGYLLRGEVVDETGLSGRYDFHLNARTPREMAGQMRERLGIDARVETRPVEYLVVDAPRPPKRLQYDSKAAAPMLSCPSE